MTEPLPDNMALTTVRGRYGAWGTVVGESEPQFIPYEGLYVRFAPAYPFVTNTTATPHPLVVATKPRQFVTDSEGYLSDPAGGFDGSRRGLNRNCLIVSSNDPDIYPRDWKYLVTFTGTGATNFRAFRTPAPAGAIVDLAVLTPQRTNGTPTTAAELAAAHAAASAFQAEQALQQMNRGQAGGVAPLDEDGDVNDADGNKILGGGGGGGGVGSFADLDDVSDLAKSFNADSLTTSAEMRAVIGAGTGSSNLTLGTTGSTAKAGNYQPAVADVTGTTSIGRALMAAADGAAARTAIGAGTGTSNLVLGTVAGTAKAGNYAPAVVDITGSTTVGRAVLAAASAIAARTAIGAAENTQTVHIAGDEVIDGVKTFLDPVVVPTAVSADQAVNLAQLNAASSGLTNYSQVSSLLNYPATFAPTLPIAQSGITGLVAALTALSARLDALEATSANGPWLLGTINGVYPPRPATTRAVWFMNPNVQPANNGVVTGGGGMVPDGTLPNGLMDFWVS